MLVRSSSSDVIARFQRAAPVKVISLAHALGLKVYTTKSLEPDVSGVIKRDQRKGGESGFAIFVNGNHVETRRRFTIAHEIAHFILHENLIGDGIVEDALLRAGGLSNSIERQANSLAANILMPWDLIESARDENITSIEDLSALFNVSRDAMSYRILGVSYQEARAPR